MKIIKYEILLKEPVKIDDIERGKPGESACLSYIPGTTICGAICGKLKEKLDGDKELCRNLLGGKTKFSNAYPRMDEVQFYPSPMGFYENKLADGAIENVLEKDPTPGYKRAGLGEFAVLEEKKVRYMSVQKKDSLGIRVSEKKIFRSVVLTAGQSFGGYLTVEDDACAEMLLKEVQGDFKIGASVTAGLGSCEIKSEFITADAFVEEFLRVREEKVSEVTMLLTSPMTMRSKLGEVCGIDEDGLSDLFGTKVTIKGEATSIVKISGVNRTWGVRTQELTMYKAGSVFLLSFAETVEREKLAEVILKGIGVNTTEGCGKVAFLDSFDEICKKEEFGKTLPKLVGLKECAREDVEWEKKFIAQRILKKKIKDKAQEYIVNSDAEKELKGIKNAQLGIVLNWAKNLEFMGSSTAELQRFIEHETEKHGREKQQSVSSGGKEKFLQLLEKYKSKELFEIIQFEQSAVMGYPVGELLTAAEMFQMKFDILSQLITYYRRVSKNQEKGE